MPAPGPGAAARSRGRGMRKRFRELAAGRAGRVALTGSLGVAGSALGVALGLPAPALLGSTLLVTAAAFAGARLEMPTQARNLAFTVIGCSLGAGFSPDFLEEVARWPASLAVLALTMVGVMLLSSNVLTRGFGWARIDALLAAAPGALSYALAMAVSRNRDVRSIMVLQMLRLLTITVTLPPLLGIVGVEAGSAAGERQGAASYLVAVPMIAVAAMLGMLAARRGLPAAHMLAGLVVSGILHGSGLETGRVPDALTFLAFATTGAVIGANFAGVRLAEIRRLALAAAASIGAALVLTAAVAVAVAPLLGLPFGQIWVAYAPGGVEAMAAMGLALGYDPAFIATHHLLRILLVILVLPILVRRSGP